MARTRRDRTSRAKVGGDKSARPSTVLLEMFATKSQTGRPRMYGNLCQLRGLKCYKYIAPEESSVHDNLNIDVEHLRAFLTEADREWHYTNA